ncbi:MAG: amino acid adenylation domain-containing protein [Acidobacteriota bacterium]
MSKSDLAQRIAALPPEKRAALLAKLQQAEGRKGRGAVEAIPRVPRDQPHYELSFAQQRLWVLGQFDPGSAEYNIPMGFRLFGALDPERMRRALLDLIARHESLRTTFIAVDGKPRQVIHPSLEVRLPVVDLRPRDRDRREPDARFEVSVDAKKPFDLEKGPLLRGTLFQLDDEEFLLYLNVHHITFDGWSNGVLVRELLARYHALERGDTAPLPEMPVQYLDFSLWQRKFLSGDTLKKQLGYWKRRIEGTPPLEFAPDRPRPAVRTYRGTTYPVAFSKDLSRRLEALSREQGCTLFVTLLAAFRTLLHRYTHQDDFAIGTLIANRTREEIEGLIGFFANTLVLRTGFDDATTFRQLMAREKETAFEAYDHQDLPFEKVVEDLNPERDLSRTPYFQVMFILQNAPTGRGDGQGGGQADDGGPSLRLGTMGVDSETSKFDFTLYLTQGEEVTGFFEYNTDLFDEGTLARLTRHFELLLEGVVADPDRRLHEYPLMAEEERRQVVSGWNATDAEFPTDACVHQLFERQADVDGDRVALEADGVRLTYRELDEQANRLAHHLLSLGARPEQFVGVATDRSHHLVVALLAVLKAGCAYLPMDPDYPTDRLAFMLEDTGAPILVTLSSLADKLPKTDAAIVLLDRIAGDLAASSPERPNLAHDPTGLAYVIHTSGSTGRPKGVFVPHRAVVNFLSSMAKTPGLDRDDTLLAVTTISFDIAGLELYLPLSQGARLVVASRETASAGEELLKLLKRSKASVMQATPATWQLLFGASWLGNPDLKVLCGGEALPPDLGDRLLRTCKSVWNVYGPTEATIWSTVHRIEADDGKAGAVPIGRPIDNTRVYLVDPHFRPVPVGVPGELLIGGDGLARGYLNRPEQAAERFVPDAFAEDGKQGRLYRTGDLARWLPDGKLSFLGRTDYQVKVRGYRIELGEIETVLDTHAAIERAVVITREDNPGTVRLVAYMVAHPKGSDQHRPLPAAGELRDFLKQKLPEYMVPAIFVPLEQLPLTPNGKVNRRALPKPDPSLLRTTEYVAPRTDEERAMAEIWQEVLDVKQVGVDDDFFELGGDSLLVIRVVSKSNKAGMTITTKQLFQNKTVADLVKVVGTSEIFAEQGPVTGPVHLSQAQHHFLELGHTRPTVHTLGAFMTAKQGVFEVDALRRALARVLEQHDSLRMRLMRVKDDHGAGTFGDWGLLSDSPWEELPFEEVDLRDLPAEDQPLAMQRHAMDFAQSLEFDDGPLFGARLYHQQDRPPMLFLIGHFMIADIGSWQIILDDLDTAYRQISRGEKLELQPKSTAFKQWMDRLVERANSEDIEDETRYWLAEGRMDVARMSFDHEEGMNDMLSSTSVRIFFSPEDTETFLKKIPRATGAQIDAILLTSVLYAFEEWTGKRSLLIDLLGHGREPLFDDVDLTRTVGWLNTIFPTYLTLGDAPHPAAALKVVNKQLRELPHGGIGYGMLRYLNRDPKVAEALRAQPEAEVFFNYFGSDMREELTVLTKDEHFGGYGLDHETRRLRPLALGGYVQEGQLQLRFEYSSNLHDEQTMAKLAAKAKEILEHLLVHH